MVLAFKVLHRCPMHLVSAAANTHQVVKYDIVIDIFYLYRRETRNYNCRYQNHRQSLNKVGEIFHRNQMQVRLM